MRILPILSVLVDFKMRVGCDIYLNDFGDGRACFYNISDKYDSDT